MSEEKEIKICSGNVEIWDQTVGCPECGKELWNHPGMKEAGLTTEQYEDLFFKEHPFMFYDAHDDGDADRSSDDEVPIGGYTAAFNRREFGNAMEKWV